MENSLTPSETPSASEGRLEASDPSTQETSDASMRSQDQDTVSSAGDRSYSQGYEDESEDPSDDGSDSEQWDIAALYEDLPNQTDAIDFWRVRK
jgi:hypothetical protein